MRIAKGEPIWNLETAKGTALVVIDTFQMVRRSSGELSYGGNYEELQKLKRIADAQHISILLVHHLRKQSDRDPVNKLSGTTGISGAVDAIFVLDRDERKQNGAKPICTGRDVEYRELELRLSKDSTPGNCSATVWRPRRIFCPRRWRSFLRSCVR